MENYLFYLVFGFMLGRVFWSLYLLIRQDIQIKKDMRNHP